MTQKEAEIQADVVMRTLLDDISDAIADFYKLPVYGPIEPTLQRLEESRFWLQKCIERQNDYLNEHKTVLKEVYCKYCRKKFNIKLFEPNGTSIYVCPHCGESANYK